MGAFPPPTAREERHTCVLTPVHECIWDVSLSFPQPEAARGRRQGARGTLLLSWSLSGAEWPQAVALHPSPFPSQSSCRGMGAHQEDAAAFRRWEPGGCDMGL